jgi:hypothetical protein
MPRAVPAFGDLVIHGATGFTPSAVPAFGDLV